MAMNPSTYKQVAENMSDILDLGVEVAKLEAAIGDIEDLPMTVKEMGEKVKILQEKILEADPTKGDLINVTGGVKVVGVHTNTSTKDEDKKASSYKHGLTLELKKVSAIGLTAADFNHEYCFVLTFVQDSAVTGETPVAATGYAPVQLAFCDKKASMYFRVDSNDTWGAWEKMSGSGGVNVIESETQPDPDAQKPGDYWVKPLAD